MSKHTIATTILCLTAAGLAHAPTPAHAQVPGSVVIEIDEPLLAPGASTTVRLLAGYGGTDYSMAGIFTSLLADAGGRDVASAWSDVALVAPMNGPGTTAGLPDGNGFAGIIAGQLNFPVGGIFSEPDPNPTPFWRATFTAPIDADGYTIDLSTLTTRFDVYPERSSARSESRLDGLTEGAGRISIVPAPASGLVLGLGLVVVRRRR